jgi:hypothetical protein
VDPGHRAAPTSVPDSLAFEADHHGDDDGWQEFEERRPRPGRRSWVLVAGFVALGGLLTVLVVSGGRTDKATAPTTPPTTTHPPTTSAPRSSAPSSTAAVAPFRTVGLGPVLGVPVGQRLVGLTRRGGEWILVDVDLDMGDSIQTPAPGLTEPEQFGAGLIPVQGGALVYAQPGPAVIVTNDGHMRDVGTGYPQTIYPGPDSGSAWWIDYRGNGAGPTLLQVRLSDSSVLASIPLFPNLQVIGTDGEGGLLLTMLGGPTWRVRPGGVIESLPTVKGSVVAAGSGVIVEERCDDFFRCGLVGHPANQDEVVALNVAGAPVGAGAIAPGGGRLALWTNGEANQVDLSVVDLSSGEARILALNGNDQLPAKVAWASPDTLVFKKGAGLSYVRLDQSGAVVAEPILVNGEAVDLELFAIGALGAR